MTYIHKFLLYPLKFSKIQKTVAIATAGIFACLNILIAQQSPEPVPGLMAGQSINPTVSEEPGLLFYLSANNEMKADFAAGGQMLPNFLFNVSVIPDGKTGPAFKCEDNQLLSYWAPGNIYAQRGTLSFFWRSGYPVGPTEFPVFRVGYADHSSWDMAWLRIDYNGAGFDAFVTDIGLSRTRISYYPDNFPAPDEWTHIALAWDETEGIRFYVNGELVAEEYASETVYDTGLDQFGPHSRIISPYQVQSLYNFQRGGDIDEIRIYDQMLSDDNIAILSKGGDAGAVTPLVRDLNIRRWRDEWWIRNGWNLPNNPPALLPSHESSIRKVEIHDAYDIKRWYWKANDGIRETTWPGVYNMSRLPGRYDYFVYPDWDCYSGSGQSVRFTVPDEPWNHVEVWGKAWGQMTIEQPDAYDYTFGVKRKNQIKSYYTLPESKKGGIIRYDNTIIEEPIGSFDVYNITEGKAPANTIKESFIITNTTPDLKNKAFNDLYAFIAGRYTSDEQTIMIGIPEGEKRSSSRQKKQVKSLPFINIMIPYTDKTESGLDGIEIKLPAMHLTPTHNGVFPVNLRIKDPLWQMRDLVDVSFSLKPDEAQTIWIDTRDRILPKDRALYITIAGAGSDLTADVLDGTHITLIYKPGYSARAEHESDRFTQVRDLYGHLVEEHPSSSRLNLYNRCISDCYDLLSVSPDNWLAQTYRFALTGKNKPEYKLPVPSENIPDWAFYQVEYLKKLEHLAMYYIDERQIGNGEFGGGLSDDGDFTNMLPGLALLGIQPGKITNSLQLHMAAYYDNDRPSYDAALRQRSLPLFTNGLSTIVADELHSYEEGIQVVGQLQLMDFGNPMHMERGMEIAHRVLNDVTRVNQAGHRHARSRYYSSTRFSMDEPWDWSHPNSYNVLHTAYLVALYNGNPELIKMFIELADGLLSHIHDGNIFNEINFDTDEERAAGPISRNWQVFWAAYYFTNDNKYLEPIKNRLTKNHDFNEELLVKNYSNEISNLGIYEYINTLGSTWIDRITANSSLIQEDRLGGIVLARISNTFPGNYVSWTFTKPASYKSAAIFVPKAEEKKITVITYNLENDTVNVNMSLWNIIPGKWKVRQGIDNDKDQIIDKLTENYITEIGKGDALPLKLIPGKYTIIELELSEESEYAYAQRPDLAIGSEDIIIEDNSVIVTVHNLGSVASPLSVIELRDKDDKVLSSSEVPVIEAPADLNPRRKIIKMTAVPGRDLSHCSVHLDAGKKILEITEINNVVKW